jgi:hypothetical protein
LQTRSQLLGGERLLEKPRRARLLELAGVIPATKDSAHDEDWNTACGFGRFQDREDRASVLLGQQQIQQDEIRSGLRHLPHGRLAVVGHARAITGRLDHPRQLAGQRTVIFDNEDFLRHPSLRGPGLDSPCLSAKEDPPLSPPGWGSIGNSSSITEA